MGRRDSATLFEETPPTPVGYRLQLWNRSIALGNVPHDVILRYRDRQSTRRGSALRVILPASVS